MKTQQTVIKTVLNYYFTLQPGQGSLMGMERYLEDMGGVFWVFIFLGNKGSHLSPEKCLLNPVCKFENLKITMQHSRFV